MNNPRARGAGSIFSTARDYAKWIRALMKRAAPLSASAHKELITPRTICPPEEKFKIPLGGHSLYCLGLEQEAYRGYTFISHDGGVSGFAARIAFIPGFEQGLVMFANLDGAYWALLALFYTWVDEVVGVPKEECTDWLEFFRKWEERRKKEAEKEGNDDPEFAKPKDPEPLGVPLDAIAGTFHDPGYKDVVLNIKDGKLMADCQDRSFPFMLTFEHLTGNRFKLHLYQVWDRELDKLRGEIRVEGGKVVAVGIGFDTDVPGGLIWFDRLGKSAGVLTAENR
jgi:hypothetical protein